MLRAIERFFDWMGTCDQEHMPRVVVILMLAVTAMSLGLMAALIGKIQ